MRKISQKQLDELIAKAGDRITPEAKAALYEANGNAAPAAEDAAPAEPVKEQPRRARGHGAPSALRPSVEL